MNALKILCNIGRRNGDFLLVNATSAHTFMEVAKHSSAPPREHAYVVAMRNALLIVDRLLGELSLERDFRTAIQTERNKLRKSLTAMESGLRRRAVER